MFKLELANQKESVPWHQLLNPSYLQQHYAVRGINEESKGNVLTFMEFKGHSQNTIS